MFCQLIIMCHFIACLWNILLEFENQYLNLDNNWLVINKLTNSELKVVYAEAYYW